MASFPAIEFPNNEIPSTFNKNAFVSKALQSDNILTSSLNVLGPSTLNTLSSNTITNTGVLTSNTITSTGALSSGSITNTGALSSGSITNTGALSSNTITSTNLLTASNGLTVTTGTITLAANSLGLATINYGTNNGQTIFVNPTANFSLVLTGVPTTILNAVYKLEIFISAKFYCTGITVNGTVLTMVAVGGLVNIASQVNASATGLIQTFTIFFTGTTTPTRVNTELLSTW